MPYPQGIAFEGGLPFFEIKDITPLRRVAFLPFAARHIERKNYV